MDEITVLMLDYNGSDNTIASVKELLFCNQDLCKVHILLNGSKHSHKEKIYKNLSNNRSVTIYESEFNRGFAGGVNYLFDRVSNLDLVTDYILLLNNDVLVNHDTLMKLRQAISVDESIGLVSPRILCGDKNNPYIAEDGLKLYRWIMQQWPRNYGKAPGSCPDSGNSNMPVANATCVMLRKTLMLELKGFDEVFFAYFEDWDFCFRMRDLGKTIVHVSDTWIWHEGSASTGKHSKIYEFLMTRNRYLIARKYLSLPVIVFVFLPYFVFIKVIVKTLRLLGKGKGQGVNGVFLAIFWLLSPKKFQQRFWPIDGADVSGLNQADN